MKTKGHHNTDYTKHKTQPNYNTERTTNFFSSEFFFRSVDEHSAKRVSTKHAIATITWIQTKRRHTEADVTFKWAFNVMFGPNLS